MPDLLEATPVEQEEALPREADYLRRRNGRASPKPTGFQMTELARFEVTVKALLDGRK